MTEDGMERECAGWRIDLLSSVICHLSSGYLVFSGPGGDLLFRVLGRSTIGAEGFHGRVRDGIGCHSPRHDHQAEERPGSRKLSAVSGQLSAVR
jgi:hypothetical protein